MMPNIDPRALKSMMDKMGMKQTEIRATRVVIETDNSNIVVENPQVVQIEMQGVKSFQVSGSVNTVAKEVKVDINDDDIRTVAEQSGVSNLDLVKKTLEETNGDIAEAIMKLRK